MRWACRKDGGGKPDQALRGRIYVYASLGRYSPKDEAAMMADLLRVVRIVQSKTQRLDQPEPVVSFTLQQHACIRREPIVAATNLDGPVERGRLHSSFVARLQMPNFTGKMQRSSGYSTFRGE